MKTFGTGNSAICHMQRRTSLNESRENIGDKEYSRCRKPHQDSEAPQTTSCKFCYKCTQCQTLVIDTRPETFVAGMPPLFISNRRLRQSRTL